jgi:hypothetical protein
VNKKMSCCGHRELFFTVLWALFCKNFPDSAKRNFHDEKNLFLSLSLCSVRHDVFVNWNSFGSCITSCFDILRNWGRHKFCCRFFHLSLSHSLSLTLSSYKYINLFFRYMEKLFCECWSLLMPVKMCSMFTTFHICIFWIFYYIFSPPSLSLSRSLKTPSLAKIV